MLLLDDNLIDETYWHDGQDDQGSKNLPEHKVLNLLIDKLWLPPQSFLCPFSYPEQTVRRSVDVTQCNLCNRLDVVLQAPMIPVQCVIDGKF